MDPFSAIAIGSKVVSAGYQFFNSRKQKKEGEELEKSLKRPTRTTSDHHKTNLAIAERMATEGLADSEEQLYIDEINAMTTNQIRRARNRKAGTLATEVAGDQKRKAMLELLVKDSQKKQENMKLEMDQRDILAREDQLNWIYNEANPYAENLNHSRMLQKRGLEGMNDAINSFSSAAINFGSTASQGFDNALPMIA